jgi:hypothetical protein
MNINEVRNMAGLSNIDEGILDRPFKSVIITRERPVEGSTVIGVEISSTSEGTTFTTSKVVDVFRTNSESAFKISTKSGWHLVVVVPHITKALPEKTPDRKYANDDVSNYYRAGVSAEDREKKVARERK